MGMCRLYNREARESVEITGAMGVGREEACWGWR